MRGFNSGENIKVAGQDKDLSDAKAFGANVYRLLYYDIGRPFWTKWPAFLDSVDRQVGVAQAAGLKVVVCINFSPFDDVLDNRDHPFWIDSRLTATYTRIWTEIATRLKKYNASIYAYDLMNEPFDKSISSAYPSQWRPLAEKIVEAIRKVDQDVWILYETGPGSRVMGAKDLVPIPDQKIIYGAHWYQLHNFTHKGVPGEPVGVSTYPSAGWDRNAMMAEMKVLRDFQLRYDVPIFMGEFSVSIGEPGGLSAAPVADAGRWYDDVIATFEEYKWSWAYHAWREYIAWNIEKADSSLTRRIKNAMSLNQLHTMDTFNPNPNAGPVGTLEGRDTGPLYAKQGADLILAQGIPIGSGVKAEICRVTGERITEVRRDTEGRLAWNLRNRFGRSLPPGMYWYRISGNSSKARAVRGNWVIIR